MKKSRNKRNFGVINAFNDETESKDKINENFEIGQKLKIEKIKNTEKIEKVEKVEKIEKIEEKTKMKGEELLHDFKSEFSSINNFDENKKNLEQPSNFLLKKNENLNFKKKEIKVEQNNSLFDCEKDFSIGTLNSKEESKYTVINSLGATNDLADWNIEYAMENEKENVLNSQNPFFIKNKGTLLKEEISEYKKVEFPIKNKSLNFEDKEKDEEQEQEKSEISRSNEIIIPKEDKEQKEIELNYIEKEQEEYDFSEKKENIKQNEDKSCKFDEEENELIVEENLEGKNINTSFENEEINENIRKNSYENFKKDENYLFKTMFNNQFKVCFNRKKGWIISSKSKNSLNFYKINVKSSFDKEIGPFSSNFDNIRILFPHINQKIEENEKDFCWIILKEILVTKQIAILQRNKSLLELQNNILFHFQKEIQLNINDFDVNFKEFDEEFNFLSDLLSNEISNKNNWDVFLFTQLFLNEENNFLGKNASNSILEFINAKYRKWYPIYTFSILKLGKDELFFEENASFFSKNIEIFIWFGIKLIKCLPLKKIEKYFKHLFWKMIEIGNNHPIQIILFMLSGDFDNENLDLLIKLNKNYLNYFLELYYVIARIENPDFDKEKLILHSLVKIFIIKAKNLLDYGKFVNGFEYVNMIIKNRNCFFSLNNNEKFLSLLKNTKMDYIHLLDDEEESIKEEGSQNLLNYFNTAKNLIKTTINNLNTVPMKRNIPNNESENKEKEFYYDKNLRKWGSSRT